MICEPAAGTYAIYIVEDDDQLRHWLSHGLKARGFRVRTFASVQEFERACPALGPGCVLADLRIPGGGAIELLEHLSTRWTSFPVIVMTAFSDVSVAVASLKSGALDFIEKPFSEDAIVELIRSVLRRVEGALHQPVQVTCVAEVARTRIRRLTTREREVMDCLVLGHSNKMIARFLGLSTRTVEVYRANVLKKMEVRSLAQLASLSHAGAAELMAHS